MRLTTRSRYGTRMVLDIAQHGDEGLVRIQDIARRQGISEKYLEQLIRKLVTAGFIISKRGPRGGHGLARPAAEITVGEIVRILEGNRSLVECRTEDDDCARAGACLTRRLWREATEAMYSQLNSVTLADLLEDARRCEKGEAAPVMAMAGS